MSDSMGRSHAPWKLAHVAALMLSTALSGCGGGGGGGETPPPPPPPPPPAVSLTVTAEADSATAGDAAISLHADASGSTDTPTWALEGPGSLSTDRGADVEYLPPDSETLMNSVDVQVIATYGGVKRQVQIAVTPKLVPGHYWTAAVKNVHDFRRVGYANGRYVAVDHNGLWHSTDGKTWTAATFPGRDMAITGPFSGPAWNGTTWVALYGDGTASANFAVTSTDGQQWTLQTQPLPWSSGDVKAGNGRFVTEYQSHTSTDGVHWTDIGKSFTSVAFGNGIFMGDVYDDAPYRSVDGLTWTPVTDPGWLSDLVFAGGQFLGYSSNENAQSPDGTTWVTTSVPFEIHAAMGAGDTFFESTGDELFTRKVGQGWTAAQAMPFTQIPADIIAGPGGFLGVSPFGWVSTSSNGLTWTPVTKGSYGDLKAVVDFNGTFVAVSSVGWALRSTDGKAWNASAMLAPGVGTLRVGAVAVAQGKGVLVTTGCVHRLDGCNGGPGMWMRSTDAVHWTHASTPAPDALVVDVIHDGQRFVAVDTPGRVYASTDGDHWTQISSIPGSSPFMHGITYGHGRYVAFGWAGLIATSTDGVSWTVSPGVESLDGGTPVLASLSDVVWDGRQFVGVGSNYTRATSPDGHTWTKGSGDGYNLQSLAACDGVIVGVSGSSAETSIDGRKWYIREDGSAGASMDAVACGHGRVVAVGVSGGIAVSDH